AVSDPAFARLLAGQRPYVNRKATIERKLGRILLQELRSNRPELFPCPLDHDAGFQPSKYVHVMWPARTRRDFGGRKGERRPDLSGPAVYGRHAGHANHAIALAIHLNVLADDRAIAAVPANPQRLG